MTTAARTFYAWVESPIGRFLLAGDGDALTMASFSTGRQQRHPAADWVEDGAALREPARQLEEYFAGERRRFDLRLASEGTAFQKAVWEQLVAIPFGETRSYGQIAERLGNPGAGRAVGAANAANRLPVFVPCHRVIGSGGSLTGFGGGLPTKRWLLDFEGALPRPQRELF